jgi:hypothetical protein
MTDFTITLNDRQISQLNVIVATYNRETKQALTVAEWLQLHIAEIAIQDELRAEHARLSAQAEQDVAAALVAAKDRLLDPTAEPAMEGDLT